MSTNALEIGRSEQVRRGLRLEYLTVAWNCAEAVIAVVSGLIAGSIALVGFGLDSVIEVSSGAILLWRLRSDRDLARREQAEQRARKLVGVTFFALAAYVAIDSIKALWLREVPEHSLVGIALAALSLVAGPRQAPRRRPDREPRPARRFPTDQPVHLPFGHPARRSGAERDARVVVGRSGCRAADDAHHRQRGPGSLARRNLHLLYVTISFVFSFV